MYSQADALLRLRLNLNLNLVSISIVSQSQQRLNNKRLDTGIYLCMIHGMENKNQGIENLLKLSLDAEMTVRGMTTRLQQIREAQAQIDDIKNQYEDQRIKNVLEKEYNNGEANASSIEREKNLKNLISSLEYLFYLKYFDSFIEIEQEIESLKYTVSKIPSRINNSWIFKKE